MNLQVERMTNPSFAYVNGNKDQPVIRAISYDYIIIDMVDEDARYVKCNKVTHNELKDLISCGVHIDGATIKNNELQVKPNIQKRVAKYKLVGREDYIYRISNCEVKLDEYLGDKVNLKVPDIATFISASCFSHIKSRLESLELPDNVVEMRYTFYECKNLKKVSLGNGILFLKNRAFSCCYNLKEITLPKYLEEIGLSCFYKCKSLEIINIPSTLKFIDYSCFEDCEMLDNIEIPSGVKELKFATFRGCKSLKNIKLNDGLESIDSSCFAGCESLEYIELPQSLRAIKSEVFSGCKNLKELDIPKSVIDFSMLTFGKGCRSLNRLIVHTESLYNLLIRYNFKNVILEEC